jgi:predicted HicB family RNase H-like nuclease
MPAPKFQKAGRTIKRAKVSVFLHPQLHTRAKLAAVRANVSLSDFVAALIATQMKWKKEKL